MLALMLADRETVGLQSRVSVFVHFQFYCLMYFGHSFFLFILPMCLFFARETTAPPVKFAVSLWLCVVVNGYSVRSRTGSKRADTDMTSAQSSNGIDFTLSKCQMFNSLRNI